MIAQTSKLLIFRAFALVAVFWCTASVEVYSAPAGKKNAAEQREQPPAEKDPSATRIVFLPPSIESAPEETFSVGVYAPNGRMVRVLKSSATSKEFVVGLNGFSLDWDGTNSSGAAVPAGNYAVRGFAIGEIKVEGVAYHGNNWIKSEKTPRYRRVVQLERVGPGSIVVTLEDVSGRLLPLAWELPAPEKEVPELAVQAYAEGGKVYIDNGLDCVPLALDPEETALDASAGFANQIWVIVQTKTGREVRAYSAAGEFLRLLSFAGEEVEPVQIAASALSDQIFLLEEGENHQRLRSLALSQPVATASPTGTENAPATAPVWQVVYQRSIRASDNFDQIKPYLGLQQPPVGSPEFPVLTLPNPLVQGEPRRTVTLSVGFTSRGALLQTTDGLPLSQLTENTQVAWVVFVPDPPGKGSGTLYQGDGAVVEEFRVSGLDQLIPFDAGTYPAPRKATK
jgi:hypothetical protein